MRGVPRVSTPAPACPERSSSLLPDAESRHELFALLEELRHTLRAENVAAYRPEICEAGWDLELACWVGPHAAERERSHRRFVQESDPDEPTFAAYDPFSIQVSQRNRALDSQRLFALEAVARARHRELCAALKTEQSQQLRVLICEGPRLLAWVGALRDEPFSEQDCALLQSHADALRQQLAVQRQLARLGPPRGLLESLLDALDQPALFFSGKGKVEFENQRARELLVRPEGRELFGSLRRAVLGKRPHPAFSLTPLRGFPGYTLALYAQKQRQLAAALEKARLSWQLTGRQASFLEHLAHGLSNKEIANQIGCAEVTVEKQLTQLFRRSGARSRTELITRLYAL